MPRRATLDVDRGQGAPGVKQGELVEPDEYRQRAETREGLRELDRMTEQMPGLNRMQRDRERVFARATNAPLGHPRMQREIPEAGQTRTPLSARQKNARRKTLSKAQATMPRTEVAAVRHLTESRAGWTSLNDALSDQVGDISELSDRSQTEIRRVDRAIQRYERHNDRGHVVYTNVKLPAGMAADLADENVQHQFRAGRVMHFDRFTAGAHQLHEVADGDPGVISLELQTRRGAYLGGSDKGDNTRHLLPRGMQFKITGMARTSFERPDGTIGTRVVVQAIDTTPDTTEGATS